MTQPMSLEELKIIPDKTKTEKMLLAAIEELSSIEVSEQQIWDHLASKVQSS